MHRVHVVHPSLDDLHESWCSPDGTVILMRDRGQPLWKAVVDLVVVADADRVNGLVAVHADAVHAEGGHADDEADPTMRCEDPFELAHKLARQERIHLIFDP